MLSLHPPPEPSGYHLQIEASGVPAGLSLDELRDRLERSTRALPSDPALALQILTAPKERLTTHAYEE